jgi:uncharacterized protein (DUF488 family)
MKLYSIGHSNRTLDAFMAILRAANVGCVADVRSYPRSRRNPQFNDDALARALGEIGVRYEHLQALGGRRAAQTPRTASPNAAWGESGFRNYADYALTESFRVGLDALCALATEDVTVMMCAERDWRQCHRQIISDHLLSRGHEVVHLVNDDESVAAVMSPAAQVSEEGCVVYPGTQRELF